MTTSGWEGILDQNERILWQGRPDGRVVLRLSKIFQMIFGLFFAGFALFWMFLAAQAGGIFWMFGLLHFFVGIGISFGAVFADAWRRRHTWYTLTDRRAFVATDKPLKGRILKDYPITADTRLSFVEGPPDSVHFTQRRTKNKGSEPTGFDRIDDGKEVYRLMRDIQRGATERASDQGPKT